MIPDSVAPGIVIRAPDKTSARESGDEATKTVHFNCLDHDRKRRLPIPGLHT